MRHDIYVIDARFYCTQSGNQLGNNDQVITQSKSKAGGWRKLQALSSFSLSIHHKNYFLKLHSDIRLLPFVQHEENSFIALYSWGRAILLKLYKVFLYYK